MDDLQLNISVPKKDKKKPSAPQNNAGEYKFVSNPKFTGKTIARKRPQNLAQANRAVLKNAEGPPKKVAKVAPPKEDKSDDLGAKLRDLSENKGKYEGKNYQELSDNIQLKQNKPRSGGWISSLFKNNPQVPRIGQRAVKPIVEKVFAGKTFSDLDLHPHSVANLQQTLGLKELMTVQQNAIPVILQGRDVLIRSQTGSGKTLAYALPIIEGLQAIRPKINRNDGIRPFHWIVPGLLSGGQKRKAEKARLRKGINVLVGTPGRINDHLRHTASFNFAKTGCLVLDEADRLLDMGYEKDVAAIVKAIEDHKKAATYDPLALMKQNIVEKVKKEDSDVETALPDEEKSTETKRGLKAFTGQNHKDLFKKDDAAAPSTAPKANVVQNEDDSDSDSDYEYFKAQREYDLKNPKVVKEKESEDDSDDDEDDEEGNEEKAAPQVNTFAAAVKSAIVEDELVLPATVNQTFLIVPMKLRLVTLCGLIVEHCIMNKKGGKMIVFVATLEMVDYLSDLIDTALTGKEVKKKNQEKAKNSKAKKRKADDEDGDDDKDSSSSEDEDDFKVEYEEPTEGGLVPVDLDMFSLHGSMPHEQRMEVFKQFRTARSGVLICTVRAFNASQSLSCVITAHMMLLPEELMCLEWISCCSSVFQLPPPIMFTEWVVLDVQLKSVLLYCSYYLAKRSSSGIWRRRDKVRCYPKMLRQGDESRALEALRTVVPGATTAQRAAIAVQARLEHTAHTNRDWLLRASRAYTSWVRFYAGYPRDVREYLDSKQLHLGHAAKAFALRDAPGTLARRVKSNPSNKKDRPSNRLTVHADEEKKRPGFPKAKFGSGNRNIPKQSSMHTASEFDSGLPPVDQSQPKHKKKKNK
ncbi:unnamed protein product [Spodoptera littoralis]|uniref:ATP-dependent RNA helicase n=1 Tax=Spodoptera littoralis TaxID=7109 RepID=A0A9P0N8G1_SPOLI|nr:unnamed protein product [Spodoptera littoralis]CAH1643611.1 unnamed protein product [Spodoptera littoralis]